MYFPIIVSVAACILQNCQIPVLTVDPVEVPYRTEHFTIYYDSFDFSPAQIEKTGIRKEYLLQKTNSYLDCAYNGVIEVIISNTITINYATKFERIYETVEYAKYDDGHEIAHIITTQEWGDTRFQFLTEGVAVAAETNDSESAFENYRISIQKGKKKEFYQRVISAECNALTVELETDGWNIDFDEYAQAGAFMHFLKTVYGIHKVKQWYQTGLGVSSDLHPADTFLSVFGISHVDVINLFRDVLLNDS